MNAWKSALFAFLCVAMLSALPVGTSAQQLGLPFNIASESYYTLNVDEGTMDVRVEAQVQSTGPEIGAIALFAMPTATDVVVTRNGEELETEIIQGDPNLDVPMGVGVKLGENTLKGALTADLVMTYAVPTGVAGSVRVEPGAIETVFVSQGLGSFVFLDVPNEANTVVDPGCVQTNNQPGGGFTRHVCGETTKAALFNDHPDVLRRCARLDSACRQTTNESPISAFVQSITDESKFLVLEEEVELSENTVTMRLLYFDADREWAQAQFDIGREALPLLEELFGFPYPFEELTMRQSHHISLAGAAGVAFTEQGELLLQQQGDAAFDNEVTVHEIAHQWAGLQLSSPWLWEGLAEYATSRLAPDLGFAVTNDPWDIFPPEPVSSWGQPGANPFSFYWYERSEAFWQAYEGAVGGPDAMTAVLARLGEDPGATGIDGRWFMDAGELESGANLDRLFLDWVWNPQTAPNLLEERREAWDALGPLRARAVALGLEGLPDDLRRTLEAWKFVPVADYLEELTAVLDYHDGVQGKAAAAGLATVDMLGDSWSTRDVDDLHGVVRTYDQAIDSIVDTRPQVEDLEPGSGPVRSLQDAIDAYAAGDAAGASSHAADSLAALVNNVASGRMLKLAQDEKASFEMNLFTRLGLVFSDPDADLAAAEAAFAAGDAETVVSKSRAAYDAWQAARGNGMKYLAIMWGVMALLTSGLWWVLQRLAEAGDEEQAKKAAAAGSGGGHYLEKGDGSWRDWENR